MWLGTRHLVLRGVTVWLATSSSALVAATVTWPGVARVTASRPAPALDTALVEGASCAVLACAAWLWLTTTVTVAQALRGRPVGRATGIRRWVLVACGVAALSGAMPSAPAAPGHHAPRAVALPYPDRAVAPHLLPQQARQHRVDVQQGGDFRTVVVRPGDSLWVIAARDLGSGADDAQITARWHALYAANRARIGPDPDLVEPGLRLLLPGKDPS